MTFSPGQHVIFIDSMSGSNHKETEEQNVPLWYRGETFVLYARTSRHSAEWRDFLKALRPALIDLTLSQLGFKVEVVERILSSEQ